VTKTQRIKKVVKELNLTEVKIFTVKELNMISEKAEVSLLEVMHYLRYGK
jgi:hypothetical protein